MMTKTQLNIRIRQTKNNCDHWKRRAKILPNDEFTHEHLAWLQDLLNLLESIRDTQTTADGKIAIYGDYVWHINRGETEVKREMVDLPETTGGRNIRHTYSSEAALKRAMAKAKKGKQ